MVSYTRRTHIVRISDAKPGEPESDSYIDVEVLDAISFRYDNGKEMVLNCPAKEAAPLIKDDTGGGHEKRPGNPTRVSHMKRIVGDDPSQKLDVEVMEIMGFSDENGGEWILDMHATNGDPSVFNTTDDTGDSNATRRTHNELISGDRKPVTKGSTGYVTVERCDAISFRGIMGQELIIKCPSNDDPNSSDPRASTYVWSPQGYDPSNEDGPKPPKNTDPNTYLAFVEGASGFLTGSTKISQGPFWWIRKVSPGGAYVLITITATNTIRGSIPPLPPNITLDLGDPSDGKPHAKLLDSEDTVTSFPGLGGTTIYFVWSDAAPFPTIADYGNAVPSGTEYIRQFSHFDPGGNFPGAVAGADPDLSTLADAAAYAVRYNDFQHGRDFTSYYADDGTPVEVFGTPASVHAAQLAVGSVNSSTELKRVYLLRIPTPETIIKFRVEVDALGSDNISALGYSDVKQKMKLVTDAGVPDITTGGFKPPDANKPEDPIVPPDVVNGNSDPGATVTNYTVTTTVIPNPDAVAAKTKPHHVQIIIDGGHVVHGPS